VIALLAAAAPLAAQSLTSGAFAGTVTDSAGRPLSEADVLMREQTTGIARSGTTDRDGQFAFALLPAGSYDLRIERLGFQPRLVIGIRVVAGSQARAEFPLAALTGPAVAIDTEQYSAVATRATAPWRWDPEDDLAMVADPFQTVAGAASVLGPVAPDLAREGLPGRFATIALNGMPQTSPHHALETSGTLTSLPDALEGFREVRLTSGGDVEWPAAGNGLISGMGTQGTDGLHARLWAEGGSDDQRGSLVLTGPLSPDSAVFVLGASVQHQHLWRPAAWRADSLGLAVASVASDSFQQDLSGYLSNGTQSANLVSGFGRTDWLLSGQQMLSVWGTASSLTLGDPAVGPYPAALGGRLTARQLSVAASLTSSLSARWASEFRVGVDAGVRDYTAGTAVPLTVFADSALTAGGARPGRFSRTTVRGSEAVEWRVGAHGLKAGISVRYDAHAQDYAADRTGSYAFGGLTQFAQDSGWYVQTVGLVQEARFKTGEVAWFGEDVWTPLTGLEVTFGLRASHEHLPKQQVPLDSEWLRLTGLDNSTTPTLKWRVLPRGSFRWQLGGAQSWILSGEAGRYDEESDPSVLAEVDTYSGAALVRRGYGALGAWGAGAAPDSTAAPVMGAALSMLDSLFQTPLTDRAAMGLSRVMGPSTSVHLRAEYRHTDYLPRRVDLNRPADPSVRESDGRLVYGTLRQDGSLIAAVPGSNRRFTQFDAVSDISPTGFSDYVGLSVSIEHAARRGLAWWASYSWSSTTDNWLGAATGDPAGEFSPFPDARGASDWTRGTSDFDVPHRVSVGADLHVADRFRLGALLRARSGLPYTPGFGAGVDVNGDGIAGNDPAFVTTALPGDSTASAAVVAGHSCLQSQVGRFANRNSCRGPFAFALDLRAGLTLFHMGDRPAEIIVDAVNVAASDIGTVDNALYLVDPTRSIATSPAGVITLPLVVNPHFGSTLVRQVPPVSVRVGLSVAW